MLHLIQNTTTVTANNTVIRPTNRKGLLIKGILIK